MNNLDLILGLLYVFIFALIGILFANWKYKNNSFYKKSFKLGLIFKLIAAISFAALYKFHYKGGDCILYFNAAKDYLNYIVDHPKATIDFLFLNEKLLKSEYFEVIEHSNFVKEYFIDGNILIHRFVLAFGWLGLYQFFPVSVLFSLFSFIGCWKIATTLSKLYPEYTKYIFFSFLFLPSLVFWPSGIGKEAICIGFLNLAVVALVNGIIFNKHTILNVVLGIFFLSIVFSVKAYIVFSFLPFFAFYLGLIKIKKIKRQFKRKLLRTVFFSTLFLTIGTVFLVKRQEIITVFENEFISGALYLVQGQQNVAAEGDSSYDIGINSEDIKNKNILPYIIPSIIVALFRPFPWEVNKVIMFLSFIESFFFLLFTLYILLKGYLVRSIKIIFSHEFILFAISFSLVFAFFVGLVSANFGTLVRYKTPFISYYLLALLIIKYQLDKSKPSKSITHE